MDRYVLLVSLSVLLGSEGALADETPSWGFSNAPAAARQSTRRTPTRSFQAEGTQPRGTPSMPYLFGYPRASDPLFDKTPLPSFAPQHLERPVLDRPRYEVPNIRKPSYGLDPIRKPAYQMPLAILPTDNKPRVNPPHYFKEGFKRPTIARQPYIGPNYVIKPTPLPADTRPGYQRPMWQPPMVSKPRYVPPEYKKQPRYVPPPYIATPR